MSGEPTLEVAPDLMVRPGRPRGEPLPVEEPALAATLVPDKPELERWAEREEEGTNVY